jgi:thiamine kinase-like enzyme
MNVIFEASVRPERQQEIVELLDEFDIGELRAGCRIRFLPGGACNENYAVDGNGSARFVLRLAGLEVDRFNWDRKKGADAHRSAASAGVAPELVAIRLPEGHSVARWVDGPILNAERIREPGMLGAVGRTLRTLHDGPRIEGAWSVFDDIRDYTATARAEGLELPGDYDELLRRVAEVEAAFEAVDGPEGMCHNDLQLQNFIIGDDRLWLLDFEFAGRGNRYFDLGNTAVNAELGDEELAPLVEGYFGRYEAVERARTKLMMFMAAFREAVWAVLAAPVLTLEWDYVAWAAEYFRRSRVWSEGEAFEQALALAPQRGGAA